MGRKSTTRGGDTSTSQVTNTTSTGIQDTEGVAIAGGGNVSVNLETTDLGAVQGAFDFSEGFAEDAFDFAASSQIQAGELAERSIETSQQAIATLATGGASDLRQTDQKTIAIIAAAIAAIFVLPQVLRRTN